MTLVYRELPGIVAAHFGNRDLPLVRTDSTGIGVMGGGSRK